MPFYDRFGTRKIDPENPPEDCLSCKIIGTGTFTGLSLYTFYQRTQIPKTNIVHRGITAGLSIVFAGVAITRAVI